MNENAGCGFSVNDTLVNRRFWQSVLFCIGIGLLFNTTTHAAKDLFSTSMLPVKNTPQETVLQWNIEPESTEADHTALLFAHGPVSSASYFVESFEWVKKKNNMVIAAGNESRFPPEFQPRFPFVQLRETGYIAGCRAASITIRFQLQDQLRQTGNEVIYFPSGTIKILYPQQDEIHFTSFAKALDEAAQTLYINYPPFRKIAETQFEYTELPYMQFPSIKLITRQEALYEISAREIISRLRTNNINVEETALFQNRAAIPRVIIDQNGNEKKTGMLHAGDAIRFYAPKSQSAFSPETVTWFTLHKDSTILPYPLERSTSPQSSQTAYRKIELENDVYHIDDRKRNEEQNQHWMWHSFADGGFDTAFFIHEPVADTTGIIRISLDVKSGSYPVKPEHVYTVINTIAVTGEISHQPPNQFELEAHFSSASFIQDNTMSVFIDDAFQQSNPAALNKIEIFYPVQTQAANEPYVNPVQASEILIPKDTQSVWGIASKQDETNVYFNSAASENQNSIATNNIETFYFLPANPTLLSPTVETVIPSAQRTVIGSHPAQADVLILSPRAWQSALIPYQDALEQQGLTSIFVAAEDVYDLYGDGRMSPMALRDFIRHAYQTWEDPKPSYVVLTGDATWDYWGRYQNGIINNLPAYQGDGNYAIENWFARCDDPNDKLPDIVISRIPVRTIDELQTVIQKTLAYRDNPPVGDWMNQAFVLTDDEFEEYTSELLADWIPSGFQTIDRHIEDYPLVDNIYLPSSLRQTMRAKTSLAATADILNILNKGVFLWEFFGHGAPNVMGKQRLFFGGGSKFSDVKKLSAQSHPHILWSFSCETTRFDYPLDKWNISIGEDLLTLPNGGAVALMGAAGRGYPQDHILLGRGLHEAAFDYGISTFGLQYYSAQMMSLAFKQSFEPIDQFAIFGDPALPMPRFINLYGTITESNNQYDYSFQTNNFLPNSTEAKLWVQNADGTMKVELKTVSFNHTEPFKSRISKAKVTPFKDGKLGIHLITKQDGRIIVGHGAVNIPTVQPSSKFIEPATGALPDIAFVEGSLTVQPSAPRSGETIFIEAAIINKGKASAKNFTVQGFKVEQDIIESPFDVVVGGRNYKVEILNPNEKQKIKLRWDPTANAGENTFRLKADSEYLIDEEDENNNTMEGAITVKKKSDLVIKKENVKIIPSANGQQYRVSFKVINEGESAAERVLIQCNVMMNGQESILTLPIDPATKTVIPATIVPQGAYSANEFGIPINIESFEIIVDPDEIVDEETHENNRFIFQPN